MEHALELLKASGWQTCAIAVAAGLFLLGVSYGWIPTPGDGWMALAWAAFLLSGFLWLATAASGLWTASASMRADLANRRLIKKEKDRFVAHMPHLTDEERAIFAYLLSYNQKTFTCASDGGYAVTLISGGFIIPMLRPNQAFRENDMPVCVPEHIWEALQEHRGEFTHRRPREGVVDPHPWRVPWMLQ